MTGMGASNVEPIRPAGVTGEDLAAAVKSNAEAVASASSWPTGEGDPPVKVVRRVTVPVDPAKVVGEGGVRKRLGVRSPDYGTGTVVGYSGNGVQIYWDEPLAGTSTHLLDHDLAYVERLERLDE